MERGPELQQNQNGNDAKPADEKKSKEFDWKKIWPFILNMKIELVFLFYALPGYLNFIGLDLLPLEKACRIDLQYPDNVCRNLNNAELKLQCGSVTEFLSLNKTQEEFDEFLVKLGIEHNIESNDLGTLEGVCKAETEAQILKLDINQKRAPLGYLALVVIIFAGHLGDKYNRKKAFLFLPMLGELISVLAYLTTSIFKTKIGMGFHLYVERIVVSLSGGFSLMLMGVFSFLAATTKEEDRTFRFGVFSIFSAGLGVVVLPLAAYAFEALGYVNLFLFCAITHTLGLITIIFFIKEVPAPKTTTDEKGVDNTAFAKTGESTLELRSVEEVQKAAESNNAVDTKQLSKNIIQECIDVFVSNLKVFKVKRSHSARSMLILIMIGYILLCIAVGELEVFGLFGRESWGWTTEFSTYQSYNTLISFIGTLIVTGLLVEVWKLADPILVMISLACSITAKPMLALTKSFYTIYLATTIEMFNSTRVIAVRSLISKIVAPDELGKIYSVMSVIETLINPVSVFMYNFIYEETISSFPGTFYFVTVGIYSTIFLMYFKVNSLLKKNVESLEAENKTNDAA